MGKFLMHYVGDTKKSSVNSKRFHFMNFATSFIGHSRFSYGRTYKEYLKFIKNSKVEKKRL
jgi:hypothetical protein